MKSFCKRSRNDKFHIQFHGKYTIAAAVVIISFHLKLCIYNLRTCNIQVYNIHICTIYSYRSIIPKDALNCNHLFLVQRYMIQINTYLQDPNEMNG